MNYYQFKYFKVNTGGEREEIYFRITAQDRNKFKFNAVPGGPLRISRKVISDNDYKNIIPSVPRPLPASAALCREILSSCARNFHAL